MTHAPRLRIEQVFADGKSKLLFQADQSSSIRLGREASCDIVLKVNGVSRQHCSIFFEKRSWILKDLNSTNGVIVVRNGENNDIELRGGRIELKPGDRLEVGEASLLVTLKPFGSTGKISFPETASADATQLVKRSKSRKEKEPKGFNRENPMRAIETVCFPNPVQSYANSKLDPDDLASTKLFDSSDPSGEMATHFRGYHILKKIGQGGMGVVYLPGPLEMRCEKYCNNSRPNQPLGASQLAPSGQ